jgi:hypothetical protein
VYLLSGRKTKLTKELTDEIVKRIRAGNYIKVACQAVGISQTAYFDWINKGEQGIEPYAEFLGAVKKAESEAHVNFVAIIASQAPTQWQAAAWWLERKFPGQWAKKEKIEIQQEPISSKEVEAIEARFSHLSPKELNKYVNNLSQKMLYGGTTDEKRKIKQRPN